MATYVKRVGKNDRITYLVQTTTTDDFGKRTYKAITWKNPDNLPGKRAETAAHAFGELWEKELRLGKSEKPKDTIIPSHTFAEMADEWLAARQHTFSDNYYIKAVASINRMKEFWKDKPFAELKAWDVEQFFIGLNNYKYQSVVARVKSDAKEKLNEILIKYGVKRIKREMVAPPTLANARKGGNVQWDTAERICKTLELPTEEIFEKICTEKSYKKETILQYQRVLSAIYNHAIKHEYVMRNYASSVYLQHTIGGEDSDEINILSDEENERLLDVLYQKPIEQALPMLLMMTLGIRKSEVCGLEWQDIDFQQRMIYIRRNRVFIPQKGIVRKELKTKESRRLLYMCNALYEKLNEYKDYYERLRDADSEFDTSDALYCTYTGKPANPDKINILLKEYLIEASCPHITSHKLRHGFITRMIDNGVLITTVSKLAGHSNVETTLRIYTHYRKCSDNSQEIMEKLFSKKAEPVIEKTQPTKDCE